MQKIVIFGKGGIGKSTIVTNLAAIYAQQGKKVLLLGCDPKHDTTLVLTGGRPVPFVAGSPVFHNGSNLLKENIVHGRLGIDCVEAGGPDPGVGCAGRGISRMLEMLGNSKILESAQYDIALFDVLGDVVCGGFAAPLRQGFAEKVCIVVSEELLSLYAANNIARAIRTFSPNGISLIGLVANLRSQKADKQVVRHFARKIGTDVLTFLSYDPMVQEAQRHLKCIAEYAKESQITHDLRKLARKLCSADPKRFPVPTPLSDLEFSSLSYYILQDGHDVRKKISSLKPRETKAKRTIRNNEKKNKRSRHIRRLG